MADSKLLVEGIGSNAGGTSNAAPRISAALALIWGSNPDMEMQEIIDKLHDLSKSLSQDSEATRNNMTGHGIPDLSRLGNQITENREI